MAYRIMFDGDTVGGEMTMADAIATARRLMVREPFCGAWAIIGDDGAVVADFGLIRGTQWAAHRAAAGLPVDRGNIPG